MLQVLRPCNKATVRAKGMKCNRDATPPNKLSEYANY